MNKNAKEKSRPSKLVIAIRRAELQAAEVALAYVVLRRRSLLSR